MIFENNKDTAHYYEDESIMAYHFVRERIDEYSAHVCLYTLVLTDHINFRAVETFMENDFQYFRPACRVRFENRH